MVVEDFSDTVPTPIDGARDNAILFRGDPISKLPTQRIFKYVSLSTTPPLGLEWVDDTNVVLVWSSIPEARSAFHAMREAGTLEMAEDDEGFLPARPMPETLAPMEMRLEKALGKSVQEAGQMWMRWARPEDVKAKGGKSKSKFYERYGENAGKEGQNVHAPRAPASGKRKRREYEGDDGDDLRKKLDAGMHTVICSRTQDLPFHQSLMGLSMKTKTHPDGQSHPDEDVLHLHHNVVKGIIVDVEGEESLEIMTTTLTLNRALGHLSYRAEYENGISAKNRRRTSLDVQRTDHLAGIIGANSPQGIEIDGRRVLLEQKRI